MAASSDRSGDSQKHYQAGAINIFERAPDGGWHPRQLLRSPYPGTNDRFRIAGLSGDNLVGQGGGRRSRRATSTSCICIGGRQASSRGGRP